MSVPVFIGDELTASGFRLGGARVHIADDVDVEEAFENAAAGADLVLISAHCVALLPADTLAAALSALRPLVMVVPDATGTQPPDVAKHVRHTLDLEQE
jgi:vacuolar-type H+-ATPase subunit F/Vma7